jgi:hypothetical protein
MPDDLFSDDELPEDARALVDKIEGEVRAVEADAAREISEIERRARREVESVRARIEGEVRQLRQRLAAFLKPLQETYAREGKLDEALAIRARVRALRVEGRPSPDPGNLVGFGLDQAGRGLLFDVTGDVVGMVWGTDIYTADSRLAAAAVHAGALTPGQRGVVRVTIVDAAEVTFTGSLQNGVQSYPWGPYRVGYRVSRP